ncbi:glycogen debranching N-terminal domain-containing protein [Thermus thermamylovorans]|uniref:Amylo-alpha-1,6-glucosidase n=1 Tax=Thermus thermamylovorans TaxID=2509362 RepID=A0A4Q9AYN9_9DEIN|nr:glycogen debranching N-terminal domain-containing protein [Thermus thermamylovorans]TBH16540.1 amylo-alpha-1,6-glucosidase [Thermus thermamylovorans]
MLPLKEDDTYLVLNARGFAEAGAEGFYRHDTRFLARYRLDLPEGLGLLETRSPRPDLLLQDWARFRGPEGEVHLRRELRVMRGRVLDRLAFRNLSREPLELRVGWEARGSFEDLFQARGWHPPSGSDRGLSYRAADGVEQRVTLSPPPPEGGFRLHLPPKGEEALVLEVGLESPLEAQGHLPGYEAFLRTFPQGEGPWEAPLRQALLDLRALLLATPEGPVPAAGIPWFVAPFGRDSLLTAFMLLPWGKGVAQGVLRYLARRQGAVFDPFREEEPGKILHEVRLGELSRTGRVPFARYFGTVDATPLFLVLLGRYLDLTGDLDLVRELRPHWEAALGWLEGADLDGDGLLEFSPSGAGLTVHSWKDSHDSLSHGDGRLAEPPLAVSEVQGYAYAAHRAAAGFYRALGEEARAEAQEARARELFRLIQERFWLPELATYALALDRRKEPLRVKASDAGHLLWAGAVPPERVPELVGTLFSEEMWSGWGLRTLGSGEVRYNPLSYHNGSVWPHDTALFAGGLFRYGLREEGARVAEALLDLALSQPDLRLPELVGGFPREAGLPPVPYPVACRPQAWDAGALVYLYTLLRGFRNW